MKISQLVARLEELRVREGDLPVWISQVSFHGEGSAAALVTRALFHAKLGIVLIRGIEVPQPERRERAQEQATPAGWLRYLPWLARRGAA